MDLPGYPGAHVVVGNPAAEQFQLDAFGEVLLLLAAASRAGRLDDRGYEAIAVAADAIALRRDDADAGIWELEARRWAHSRLICAAGLHAVADLPDCRRSQEWHTLAASLVASVDHDAVHPNGRWQRSPDDARVDAALVLPGLRGAVPPDDPRHVNTLKAVHKELTNDGYVYRFRQDPGRPLHEAEGAFLISGFHMSLVALQQGDPVAALRWFERSRAAMGPPGLFAEEFDVVRRQLRGNLPQAFVHALLVESAHRLGKAGVRPDGFATRSLIDPSPTASPSTEGAP